MNEKKLTPSEKISRGLKKLPPAYSGQITRPEPIKGAPSRLPETPLGKISRGLENLPHE